MRIRRIVASVCGLLLLLWSFGSPASSRAEDSSVKDPFDSLFDAMTLRTGPGGEVYGADEPAPLLWVTSIYLLKGEAYEKFEAAIERFSALPQERIEAYPPIKRAILQRCLWQVFDWSVDPYFEDRGAKDAELSAPRRVQRAVAALLERVALSHEEIGSLPDTLDLAAKFGGFEKSYDLEAPHRPFLPSGIGKENGDWIVLRGTSKIITGEIHSERVRWRSAFLVLMRLPGGRAATIDYIAKLGAFKKPLVHNGDDFIANEETPQFPAGTQVALVERGLLIDRTGKIVLSPLALGIQMRVFLERKASPELPPFDQAVAEFVIQPRELFAGNSKAAMRAIGANDSHFSSVIDQGSAFHAMLRRAENRNADAANADFPIDERTEQRPHFRSCRVCHSSPGVHSMNSRRSFFQPQRLTPVIFRPGTAAEIADATAHRKKRDHTWGFLQGLWRAEDSNQDNSNPMP